MVMTDDALFECIKRKDYEEFRLRAENVEDVDELVRWRDPEGFTILHWLSLAGCNELVLRVLEEGKMDPNERGPNLQTPLMWACMDQQLVTMLILADHGASLHLQDDLHDNALSIACQHEKMFAALWLLNRQVDVNVANVGGTSPAHWAAFSGSYMILCMLEAYGFDMYHSYDRNGLLPIHRALELEFWGTAYMMATFCPRLLMTKTRAVEEDGSEDGLADGMSLEEFAESRCLPAKTMDQWLKLCRYHKHTSEAETPHESGSWFGPRKSLWEYLVDFVDFLERKETTRSCIPLLAYSFSFVFCLAHYLSLWRLNEELTQLLGFPIGGLLKILPYAGLIGILTFSCLLVTDPGFKRYNYFPIIVDKSHGPPDPKILCKYSDKVIADLDNPTATEKKERLFRSRRREIFDHMATLLSHPYALIMLSAPIRRKDTRVIEYFAKKGVYLDQQEGGKSMDQEADRRITIPYADERRLREKLDLGRVCTTCWIRRSIRTKHCSTCDRCCGVMDHHCVWINACVGERNHLLFFIFIMSSAISQWHQIALLGLAVCSKAVHVIPFNVTLYLKLFYSNTYTGCLLIHLYRFGSHITLPQLLLILLAGMLHFITFRWGVSLVSSQCDDLLHNTTVNEKINGSRYEHFIVSAECDDDGLPHHVMVESDKPIKYIYTEGGDQKAPRKKYKIDKTIPELVADNAALSPHATDRPSPGAVLADEKPDEHRLPDEPSTVRKSILSDVNDKLQKGAAMAPIIKDDKRTIRIPFIRRFLRNPFSEQTTVMESVIGFLTNTRDTEIEYYGLKDEEFIQSMRAEIIARRQRLTANNSCHWYCRALFKLFAKHGSNNASN